MYKKQFGKHFIRNIFASFYSPMESVAFQQLFIFRSQGYLDSFGVAKHCEIQHQAWIVQNRVC